MRVWQTVGSDAPMLLLLLAVGIGAGVRLRGFPLLRPKAAMQLLREKTVRSSGVSPLEALCTALAGTIGTGNIVGVAGAIALGGPGAVLWMWVSALLGTFTKYAEIVLAMETRVRGKDGAWHGGAAEMLKKRGVFGQVISVWFGAAAALASLGVGNAVQMQSILASARAVLPASESARRVFGLLLGGALALAVHLFGSGAKRVGRIAARLVPWMGGLYLLGAGAVLVRYAPYVPRVLGEIVRAAVCPEAAIGVPIGIWQTFRYGAARGVFSNEAGLGSAPMAHINTETDSSVRQGLIGSLEVLCVTAVCTVTALVLLLPAAGGANGYAIPYGRVCDGSLVTAALATVLPKPLASAVTAAVLTCFALSSILTWRLYGGRCARELFGARGETAYHALFCAVLIGATQIEEAFVWSASELLNALMATPNLITLLFLFPIVQNATCPFFGKSRANG